MTVFGSTFCTCDVLLLYRKVLDLFIGPQKSLWNDEQLLNIYLSFLEPESPLDLELAGNKEKNPLKLLKVSTMFKNERSHVLKLPMNQWSRKEVDFVSCQILFAYLFTGIESFYNTVQEFLNEFKIMLSKIPNDEKAISFTSKCLDIFKYIVVISKHSAEIHFEFQSKYKLVLESCMEFNFPTDDFIIEHYLDVKKYGMNSLDVRKTFEHLIKRNDGLVYWLRYIFYEEQRLVSATLIPCEDGVMSLFYFE